MKERTFEQWQQWFNKTHEESQCNIAGLHVRCFSDSWKMIEEYYMACTVQELTTRLCWFLMNFWPLWTAFCSFDFLNLQPQCHSNTSVSAFLCVTFHQIFYHLGSPPFHFCVWLDTIYMLQLICPLLRSPCVDSCLTFSPAVSFLCNSSASCLSPTSSSLLLLTLLLFTYPSNSWPPLPCCHGQTSFSVLPFGFALDLSNVVQSKYLCCT